MADSAVLYGANDKPIPPAIRKQAIQQARRNQLMASASGRGYTAGGFGHASTATWKSLAEPTSEAMRKDRSTVANRVRDLVRNNPDIASGIEKKVNNVVGTGWRLSAKPNHRRLGLSAEQAELIGDQIEALWQEYACGSGFWCDAARNGDANDVLLTAAYHMAMDDEAFGLIVWREEVPPSGYQTAMELIHPGRCSNPNGLDNTENLEDGITLDEFGAATGAWFRRSLPGKWTRGSEGSPYKWDWFPRELEGGRPRVVHVKPVKEAGLKRSISKLVSVMLRARQGDQYFDYETQAAMINAVMALFIETPFDMFEMMDSISPEVVGSVNETHAANIEYHKMNPVAIDGAQINALGPGEKPHMVSPSHPNTAFEPFMKKIAHTIASVLGITYEQLTMDWSDVNYSSARAAILEVARGFKVEAAQLRKQFMNQWYRAWLEEVFDKKKIDVPVTDNEKAVPLFDEMPDAWANCDWIGTGKGYVDPVKEVQAAGMRMAMGVSTLEIECAEQGHDWKVLVEQRAKEIRYMIDQGLPQSAIDHVYGMPSDTDDDHDASNGDKDTGDDELTGRQAKTLRRASVPLIKKRAA